MTHDHALRELNAAYAAGRISDDDYAAADAAIRARMPRSSPRTGAVQLGHLRSVFPPKRLQRSPDRLRSMERRRTIAASGPMPPALACRFTVGQLAALGVVADQLARYGSCVLTVAEIAARAGVSHRLVQDAVRLAEGDGLVRVEERRQQGARNLPNKVTILSRDWAAWLRRRGRGGGCRNAHPTNTKDLSPVAAGSTGTVIKASESVRVGSVAGPAQIRERTPSPGGAASPLESALARFRAVIDPES
jgi:hypothetical protein